MPVRPRSGRHFTAFRVMLALALAIGLRGPALAAHGENDELSELGLEELMDIDVVLVNVLGTHTHFKGEWMLGYSFMTMTMEGNRTGTRRVSTDDVLANFMVSPTKMRMAMHMTMLMYAPSDDLTLMAMLPYVRLSMDHVTRMGVEFTTESEGIGDIRIGGLYTFFRRNFQAHRLIFSGNVSLPTGSIDAVDFLANPAMGKQKLPYPMQLGSGTVDLHNALTYLGEAEIWGWGAEIDTTVRLGTNSNGYRLGNRYRLSAWLDWKWTDWVGPNFRIDGETWNNIAGADPDLNPAMVPTADPTLRGGETIDLSLGLTFYVPHGLLEGQRLALRGTVPIYRSLNGPQLETDWRISVGWQWVF